MNTYLKYIFLIFLRLSFLLGPSIGAFGYTDSPGLKVLSIIWIIAVLGAEFRLDQDKKQINKYDNKML